MLAGNRMVAIRLQRYSGSAHWWFGSLSWCLDQVGREMGVAGAGSDLCVAEELRPWLARSAFAPGRGGASLLPMLGLFGIFGRSQELQRLDQALRGVGLNPRLVPDAVMLTTLKLLGEAGDDLDAASYAAAAELLGYCVLGAQEFTESNDPSLSEAVEVRLAATLEAGDNLDARS